MFKKSKVPQGDLFRDISMQLSGRKQRLYQDPSAWHNVFHKEVVSRIDESIFSVLYDQRMGRPNAPCGLLMSMIILKEGQGWSDQQLFDQCRFDLQVMRAIGLQNMDDDVPTESTYYGFKKALLDHHHRTGMDLVEQAFAHITAAQIESHGVSGRKIRLDSKLIGSNIAKSGRLQLIVECLRKAIGTGSLGALEPHVSKGFFTMLCDLQQQGKSASNVIFGLNGDERQQMLIDCGTGIRSLLVDHRGLLTDPVLLERIYQEQYEEVTNPAKGQAPCDDPPGSPPSVSPKQGKDIPSGSLQSPHDPQATYRKKGKGQHSQTISGYHANITETCGSEGEVDLIISVSTVEANKGEDLFLEEAIAKAQQVMERAGTGAIEGVISDGGYDSIANREVMAQEGAPTWHITKTKGSKRAYIMSYDQDGQLRVMDVVTGKPCKVVWSSKAMKYRVIRPSGYQGYFTKEEVGHYILSQSVLQQASKEDGCLRATVESTVHQMFHRLKKNNKTVYRGILQCHRYVVTRAIWTNFRRLLDKVAGQRTGDSTFGLQTLLWCLRITSKWSTKILYHLNRPRWADLFLSTNQYRYATWI